MKLKVPKKDYKFWTSCHTRWGDMDGLRHINHAAYLSYMETSRMKWLIESGLAKGNWEPERGVILASVNVDYFTQIYHPIELEIGIAVSRVGKKSFDLLTGIFKKERTKPIVQATFVMVAFNYNLNQTIPVPSVVHKFLIS